MVVRVATDRRVQAVRSGADSERRPLLRLPRPFPAARLTLPHVRIAYETSQFRDDFRRASRQLQDKIETFITKFDQEAGRNGTRLKAPQTAVDSRVRVAR